MKKRFSDRIGVTKPSATLQLEGMTVSLRNRLWNVLREDPLHYSHENQFEPLSIFGIIADDFCKLPIDTLSNQAYIQANWLSEQYFRIWKWYDVYNFVEFIIHNYESVGYRRPENLDSFILKVNTIFEDELSGYRVIGRTLVPMTNKIEIESLESALVSVENEYQGAWTHFETALSLFSKRPDPDYRNCIKESISAVESLVTTVTNEKDFVRALRKLRDDLALHPALVSAVEKLYGYTSDEDGVRHGIYEEPNVGFDEAKFMLVTCSALINFLAGKSK